MLSSSSGAAADKYCPRCKSLLPLASFNRNRAKMGVGSYCRPCTIAYQREWRQRHPDSVRRTASNYAARHPEAQRSRALRRKYGLTPERFAEILTSQGGGCAICGSSRDLHVDHDHVSLAIRGILCGRCNRALGLFNDEPGLLALGAIYLGTKVAAPA